MGAYKEEEFTPEERAALGEAEPAAPVAEKAEPIEKGPEPKAEEKPAEDKSAEEKPAEAEPTKEEQAAIDKKGARFEDGYVIDEDGAKIPLERFRKIYYEAQEGIRTKEKLHLLKTLGPEKFYEVHPEEKPDDYVPLGQKVNPLDMRATYPQPDHPYQGLTLREIMKQDPEEGTNLLRNYEIVQRGKGDTRKREFEETAAEANEFASIVAKEMFSKDSLDALTLEEAETIKGLIDSTYQWGVTNGKQKYRLSDVWRLKNKADPVKQEKALKSLEKKPAVKSIGSGGGSAGLSGFEAYEAMTEDELTTTIDKMPDKKAAEFFKKAPDSLRKKYPKIPWD